MSDGPKIENTDAISIWSADGNKLRKRLSWACGCWAEITFLKPKAEFFRGCIGPLGEKLKGLMTCLPSKHRGPRTRRVVDACRDALSSHVIVSISFRRSNLGTAELIPAASSSHRFSDQNFFRRLCLEHRTGMNTRG